MMVWAFPPEDLWRIFDKTIFRQKLNRDFGAYFYYPEFPEELRVLEGKAVELKGFYIPTDTKISKTLILSRYPMAECFFCGGAGPESIAVAHLKTLPKSRLKMDQIIRVRGILRLNGTDVEEMTFILSDAELIK
jgi:uncharacterized membrane protein YcgQ (UPF0703/DUF1980 family)